jgi:ABC-type oligopeptide transport system substrate-binding subunit
MSPETLLYTGPFYLDSADNTKVVYKANPKYYLLNEGPEYDFAKPHIKTVNFDILQADLTDDYARGLFETDKIDGFTLNSKDFTGWQKHVLGPDGTGTIQNPYDPLANSREYTDISFLFHRVLNLNRDFQISTSNKNGSGVKAKEQNSLFTDLELANTNKALKIKEVRELVLKSTDFTIQNRVHGETLQEQKQVQVNTFVPADFVYAGEKDYTEFYFEEYAAKEGITVAEAKTKLKQGEYDGVNLSDAEVGELTIKARKAIDLYNASNSSAPITLPIKLEMVGPYQDTKARTDDQVLANYMLARIHGFTRAESLSSGGRFEYQPETPYDLINIQLNNNFTSATLSMALEKGYAHLVSWGWAPDYADPRTYLNCYTTNGEMAFTLGNTVAMPNYYLDSTGENLIAVEDMFGEYNDLVAEASLETDSYANRYALFAQAEYMLLNQLYVMQPSYMSSIGWRVSISRNMGYDTPESSYGLASNKYTGIYVLKDVMTRAQRNECFAKFSALKTSAIDAYGRERIYD